MSPKSLRWQYRTLRVAMTVGCVSSIQFAGCLNNPTRTDLAAEAGKAALLAEEDITHQKTLEALAAAESEPSPAADHESSPDAKGRVVLAGGESHPGQEDSPILQTNGEEPQTEAPEKKKSFWNFWPGRSSKPVVKDPFANNPELKSTAPPQNPNSSAGKAKLATTATPVPDRKPAEKDPFSAENWFEKELASQPVPSWAQIDQPGTEMGKGVPVTFQKSSEEKSQVGQARLNRPASSMPDTAPWAAQPDSKLKSAPAQPTSPWDAVTNSPQPRTQLKNAASAPAHASSPESVVVRQQKLRIQALLSDAHSNAQRGELHNAYRSALLAEKIASDHQLTFAEGEEHPQTLSRSLAAKLWQTSNASEAAYLAAADLHAPTANQPIRSPATPVNESNSPSANNSFPGGSFATWQPLPESATPQRGIVASTATPSTNDRPGPTLSMAGRRNSMPQGAMPQIRPWVNERTVQETAQPDALSNSSAGQPAPGLTAPMMPQDGLANRPSPADARHPAVVAESGVQFAIAHELHEDQPPKLLDSLVSSGSSARTPADHTLQDSMASAALDRQRTVLMAPPTPADTGARATADSSLTWEQISRADSGEDAAQIKADHDAQVIRRVIWSIVGLLGAVITTGIGVWYSKRKQEKLPAVAQEEQTQIAAETPAVSTSTILGMATDSTSTQDEPEVQQLPFKRAA